MPRMGLEAIPDPVAGEALRTALPGLTGGLLIGVINSLAARRETCAVEDLGRYLTHTDPQVAAAACAALGTIASPDSLTLVSILDCGGVRLDLPPTLLPSRIVDACPESTPITLGFHNTHSHAQLVIGIRLKHRRINMPLQAPFVVRVEQLDRN